VNCDANDYIYFILQECSNTNTINQDTPTNTHIDIRIMVKCFAVYESAKFTISALCGNY